ncbi:MAG: hypothetical protein OXI71_08830 [Gemmatimonadota bacterium]|nr:hypothetical protein [Gemmatimonadota bacterium]
MKTLPPPAVPALLALAVACGQDDAPVDQSIFTPDAIGTAALPLSESHQVALLADERVACVVDSYETRVRCVDPEGAVVGVFGRVGEGPGEFGRSGSNDLISIDLVRGEEGTVGVYDQVLFRFTLFEPSGAYVSQVRAPFLHPLRSFGTVLSGVVWRGWIPDTLMVRYDVSVASGEVVREQASPSRPGDVECGQGESVQGIPDRAEGWVFLACGGRLIVFAGNTGDATVLRPPTYLPDERDVAREEERLWTAHGRLRPAEMSRVLQMSSDGTYRSVVERRMEDYRATPKPYDLGTEHQLFDAANRYWIATQRDTHEWSYLDVYENAEFVRSVRVRDRLRAFDLVGSTLVVLVDRQLGPDDPDGIPDRALDWYDVGDLRSGR